MTGASIGQVQIDAAEVEFTHRKKSVLALAPLSMELAAGSFTALIGPSGCGKSTLLNAIAGFTPPTRGQITIDGLVVRRPSPDAGVVFQQYALFPWFTALGNVEFALKRLVSDKNTRREMALQALDEVGLADRASNYPGQLSGGMRQRVALARTFAAKPKVLLMDEPFGALDAQTRISMHELLLKTWESRRTTVLFITHDIDEALLLSDRILVMSSAPGKIIDSISVLSPRPRAVSRMDSDYIAKRTHMFQLLRPPPISNTTSSSQPA